MSPWQVLFPPTDGPRILSVTHVPKTCQFGTVVNFLRRLQTSIYHHMRPSAPVSLAMQSGVHLTSHQGVPTVASLHSWCHQGQHASSQILVFWCLGCPPVRRWAGGQVLRRFRSWALCAQSGPIPRIPPPSSRSPAWTVWRRKASRYIGHLQNISEQAIAARS